MSFSIETGQIFSVSALTELIRNELEHSFPFVWVKGEVSDLSLSSSGHMYFSLKDANSLLQCVWFARARKRMASQKFDPLTGEVFDEPRPDIEKIIRNGLELICSGSINLYAKGGRYQLIVEYVELSGEGALALAFEKLKAKYSAAGYFALERKRPLPSNPLRIALITSPKGAAIHDFLKLAASRGLSSKIRLFPVTVQGKGAAEKMAQAIEEANNQDWAQLIVLIRGGGSAADLMEFNEPVLVEAIFNSRLPVLAGIGHEVDVFLSDMTADVRAATPSHAAQILWPLRRDIWQKLDDLEYTLDKRVQNKLIRLEELFAQKLKALDWFSPLQKLKRLDARLMELESRLRVLGKNLLDKKEIGLDKNFLKLKQAGMLANKIQLALERLLWLSRSFNNSLQDLLLIKAKKLQDNSLKLEDSIIRNLDKKERKLEKLEILLRGNNPLEPLKKGYALLTDSKGIVHSVSLLRPGQELQARLSDGTLDLTVTAIHKNEEASHA